MSSINNITFAVARSVESEVSSSDSMPALTSGAQTPLEYVPNEVGTDDVLRFAEEYEDIPKHFWPTLFMDGEALIAF